MPDTGDCPERVAELFRRQAPDVRPQENIIFERRFAAGHGGKLIGLGGQNALDGFLQIVMIGDQVFRQPVQQIGVPGGLFHVIHRLDQAASNKLRPEPVDDRAREPAILLAGDHLGQPLATRGLVGRGRDLAELRVDEAQAGFFAGRFVATVNFQRFVAVNVGQAIGLGERPVVDKTVVTGSALQIHAHEDLRDILRGLHRRDLAGVDRAAPDDASGEPVGIRRGIDELGDEAVVREVGGEPRKEPGRDLFASAVDVAGAAIVIAQRVVPESEPMFGVTLVVGQQAPDEPGPFVGARVGDEGIQLFDAGQQADHVQVRAPGEHPIFDRFERPDFVLLEVGPENLVDGIPAVRLQRECRLARLEIDGRRFGESNPGVPGQALVDPGAQAADLLGGQLPALLGHHVVRVEAADHFDQEAFLTLARRHRGARLAAFKEGRARIEPEVAFGTAPPVALDAARLDDRLDILAEINLARRGRGQFRGLFGRELAQRPVARAGQDQEQRQQQKA